MVYAVGVAVIDPVPVTMGVTVVYVVRSIPVNDGEVELNPCVLTWRDGTIDGFTISVGIEVKFVMAAVFISREGTFWTPSLCIFKDEEVVLMGVEVSVVNKSSTLALTCKV